MGAVGEDCLFKALQREGHFILVFGRCGVISFSSKIVRGQPLNPSLKLQS